MMLAVHEECVDTLDWTCGCCDEEEVLDEMAQLAVAGAHDD